MLLLAEGGLRLFPLLRPLPRTYVGEYKNRPNPWLAADPLLGWKMQPHHRPDFNTQGFRAISDFDPKQHCKRIAFAGDSFTFALGVEYEKAFSTLIEAGIPGSCAANMGIPGFGLDQIWLTVRTQALPLQPRLVVVSFISGDLTRSEEAYRNVEGFNKPTFKLAGGRLVPETAEDRPNLFVRFLQHHSSLWRLVRLADRTLAHRYAHGEWWHLNAAILDMIREDSQKANVPVLFIYIPSREWGTFPTMRAYMVSHRANFIDLSQGEFALTPDMYLRDGHLNEKGHLQVADAVQNWLRLNLAAL